MLKSEKDLSIFLNVRKHSTRCPNKMLRPFAGTTLLNICLEKIDKLGWHSIYYGAHEEELLEEARKYDRLKILKRSYESAHSSSDASKIFEILKHIPTRWVLWINPSHPFLTIETVEKAVKCFLSIENNSLTSVRENRGWFYFHNGAPINNKDVIIDTKKSDFIYEVAHAFHIYEREFMIKNQKPWENKKGEPYLFPIPHIESYDIDTEEEFYMAESLYRKYKGQT